MLKRFHFEDILISSADLEEKRMKAVREADQARFELMDKEEQVKKISD